MSDRYGYIGIETLLNFCENSKDHAVTPNDFMRMKRVREPEHKWIPCSERLPEVGQDVLFSVQDLFVSEGCLRDDGDWSQFRWQAIQKKEAVTAWMPLPEPYRKEGD